MSEENKHIILINGIPTTVDLTDVEPILNENKRLLKMNDNWYVVDKVFYDYVDKYQQAIYKIKEIVKAWDDLLIDDDKAFEEIHKILEVNND